VNHLFKLKDLKKLPSTLIKRRITWELLIV